MPSRPRSNGWRRTRSWSSRTRLPDTTGTSPMMDRSVVVLPAPFRPTSPTMPPAGISRESERRIESPPSLTSRPRRLSMLRPSQERPPHRGVGEDGVGRPGGDDLALVEREHPLGVALDDLHVVLDEDRGHARPLHPQEQRVYHRLLFPRADAFRRLVS